MIVSTQTPTRRVSRLSSATLVLLCVLLLLNLPAVQAQEDAISPPAPLPWPFQASPDASRGFGILFLRDAIEKGGNEELCKALMTEANRPIPANFEWSRCPAEFQAKVNAREGKVSWAEGAKPLECGTSCVGRPFMTQSSFLDQPNTIFAMLYGHLNFEVDVPGPFNRTVRYGYEAQFRCLMEPGARTGALNIRLKLEPPVVGESGLIEDIFDFIFLPANLSRTIEAGIRDRLSTPGSQSQMGDPCVSIGVSRAADLTFDSAVFDEPPPTRRPTIRNPLADTALSRRATVRFYRITRKPVFGYTPPADAGDFHVFLNGTPAYLPTTPALDLPASGGSAAINLCKTIDMNGADRLQLVFVNSHGGAVWSQFAANTNFGAGPPRTMTTGRKVVVSGQPRPPSPGTGRPGSVKPQPVMLREFELLYTIEYQTPANQVSQAPPATEGGVKPTRPGTVATPLADAPVLADPGGGEPPEPCRQL